MRDRLNGKATGDAERGRNDRVGKKGGRKRMWKERVQEGAPEMQKCKGDKGCGCW